MGVLIDLNIVNNEDEEVEEDYPNINTINNNNYYNSRNNVCMDLWHACAGPLISLPKKGSLVVYFPQGHLKFLHNNINNFNFNFNKNNNIKNNIPNHVFCQVLDVKLHAEIGTDEVYAQVSLIPETQVEEKLKESGANNNGGDEDEYDDEGIKSKTPQMFCKTLTASDTSTHGGFSVPRRAAEDCFPPLDYNQQRPSQEIVAKDLHGLEWRFRHIYRGQPRRHLLTTGWSAFVNKRKLVSGDAVLFLRGADGELRLGIRRAVQLKGRATFPSLSALCTSSDGLTAAFEAISSGRAFNVCYNPRESSSEFIVPSRRYLKSINTPFNLGTRFKMRVEADDATERRYTGVVTGRSELDPVIWPGSKWRCVTVRWDDVEVNQHGRVSPWEIEPTGSFSSPGGHNVFCGLKRTRIGLPLTKPDFPIPCGTGVSDFGESLAFQKVLQGQEKPGSHPPYNGNDNPRHSILHLNRYYPSFIPPDDCRMIPNMETESFRFQKVLQGQETHLTPSQVFEGIQVSRYGSYPGIIPSYASPMNIGNDLAPPRLFGFSLIDQRVDKSVQDLKFGPFGPFPSQAHPKTPLWPLIEGQPFYKSPFSPKDMLLDIAL